MSNLLGIYLNSLKFTGSFWKSVKSSHPETGNTFSENFTDRISGRWDAINITPALDTIYRNLILHDSTFKGDTLISIPDSWVKVVILDTEEVKSQDELNNVALWKIRTQENPDISKYRISTQLWKHANKALALISGEEMAAVIEKWGVEKGLKIRKILPHSLSSINFLHEPDNDTTLYLFINEDGIVFNLANNGVIEYYKSREIDYSRPVSVEQIYRDIKSIHIFCKQKLAKISTVSFFTMIHKAEILLYLKEAFGNDVNLNNLSGSYNLDPEILITKGLF